MPRQPSLSIELMETFLLIVDLGGNAARAADELGINQPSISKRLKSLQHSGKILAKPWLQREGKTWKLTPEGERVLPAVRDLLSRHHQLTQFVEDTDTDVIRFSCGQRTGTMFVTNSLVKFYKRYPQTRFRLPVMRGRDRIEQVATGSLEFALVSHNPDQILKIARRPMLVESLLASPYSLVADKHSAFGKQLKSFSFKTKKLDALPQLPLILPEPDSAVRTQLQESASTSFGGASLFARAIIETGGWNTILEFAQRGLGIGLVPLLYLTPDSGIISLTIPEWLLPPMVTRLICRANLDDETGADLSPLAAEFISLLREEARELSQSFE